jgi:hypothetical protein
MTDVKWVKRDPQERKDPDLMMPEDELGELEREILTSWPDVAKGFATIRPGAHPLRMHKSSTDPPEPLPRPSDINGKGDEGSAEQHVLAIGNAKRSPTLKTL